MMPVRIWIALLGLLVFGAVPAMAVSGRATPSSAEPGDLVSVTGSDFTPDRPCHLHVTAGSTPSDFTNQVGTCNLDSMGRVSGSFSVPEVTAGSYTVWICSAPGNAPCSASSSETIGIPFVVQTENPPPTTTTTTTTTTLSTTTTTTPSSSTTTTTTTTAPDPTTTTGSTIDDDPASPTDPTNAGGPTTQPAIGLSDPSSDVPPVDQPDATEPVFVGRFLQDAPQATASGTKLVDPLPTGAIVASVAVASAAAVAAVAGISRLSGRVQRPRRSSRD